MQPHSMCALALANIVWNDGIYLASARFLVKYKTNFGEKLYYYDVKNIEYAPSKFTATIGRSGGGQPCTMTAKIDHHQRVEMTHQTIHVSGLTELFILRKEEIKDGEHRNSLRYRRFWGKIKPTSRIIELNCEVKTENGRGYVTLPYVLSVDSMTLKNTFPKF